MERESYDNHKLLLFVKDGMSEEWKCRHDKVEFIGEQKGEVGVNKYFKCLRCGSVLILSEDGVLYEVSAGGR